MDVDGADPNGDSLPAVDSIGKWVGHHDGEVVGGKEGKIEFTVIGYVCMIFF
jgi:hypothetical protein